MRLFLFDIDGTLLYAHRAGRACLVRAMESVFGTAGDYDRYDWRGKTDPQIVSDLMRKAGIREAMLSTRLQDCFDAYARFLAELLAGGHPVDVLPGVRQLLEGLAAREDCLVGLLTGNVKAGARLKLAPTGLLPYFRVAAYGSDDSDRRQLPLIARDRARALVGQDIPCSRLVILGDTPLDVDCARACGAVAVAVATGQHSADELAACGPDLLFRDFSDVNAVLQALATTDGPSRTASGLPGASGRRSPA